MAKTNRELAVTTKDLEVRDPCLLFNLLVLALSMFSTPLFSYFAHIDSWSTPHQRALRSALRLRLR